MTLIPGEVIYHKEEVVCNEGRETLSLRVSNSGDRPVQVGSHYHFYEVNPALHFTREMARGMRLNIAAGTAVRFEPGEEKEVELVCFAGEQVIYGFRGEMHPPGEDLSPRTEGATQGFSAEGGSYSDDGGDER